MSEAVKPEVLISRLSSPNEQWRVEAEGRLIALGAAAVEPLTHALQHANPAVRIHAVHALARIGDPRGIPAVIQALGDRENHGAGAIAAEKALVEWGAAVVPPLLEASRTGDEGVRARALRALGRAGGASVVEAVRPMLADPLPSIRIQAAGALAALLKEESIELIAPLLQDADKWVRWEVAETLVQQGCIRGEVALREAAEDEDEQGTHTQYWAEDLLDEIDELRRTERAIP